MAVFGMGTTVSGGGSRAKNERGVLADQGAREPRARCAQLRCSNRERLDHPNCLGMRNPPPREADRSPGAIFSLGNGEAGGPLINLRGRIRMKRGAAVDDRQGVIPIDLPRDPACRATRRRGRELLAMVEMLAAAKVHPVERAAARLAGAPFHGAETDADPDRRRCTLWRALKRSLNDSDPPRTSRHRKATRPDGAALLFRVSAACPGPDPGSPREIRPYARCARRR